MRPYEYGRIRVLAEKLAEAGVPEDICARILEGGERVTQSTSAEKKADWMRGAMSRMDALLDKPTRQCIREGCACCLGGKRLKLSKGIAKEHATLEDRIAAANETPYVFGYGVSLEPDGRILVRFEPEGKPGYRCVCLPKAKEPVSETYCYCCGGHIKHHLQIALGRKVSCEVKSSALSSGGTHPCAFLYAIAD